MIDAVTKRHRILMPLVLTAAAAVLVYSLLHQSQPQAPTRQATGQLPQYVLEDVDLTRYDAAGQPQLRAHAEQLEQFPDGYSTGSQLEVHTSRGGMPWTASAPEGQLNGGKQPVHLTGGVQAHSRWPDSGLPLNLETPELWIDVHDHSLYTTSRVKLHGPDRRATALGLRANWVTQSVSLLADVHSDYDLPPAH